MPDIKITFAEVRTKTNQIRKHNQTLDDTLKQVGLYEETIEKYKDEGASFRPMYFAASKEVAAPISNFLYNSC